MKPKERGQARLPDPETSIRSFRFFWNAFQGSLLVQLQSAQGQEGGLAPALYSHD